MSTWCDKLGSTPTVGIRLDTHFATTESLLTAFSPLLDRTIKERKPVFNLDKTDQFAMSFTTFDGFQYSADPSRLAVAFRHRLKAQHGEDGLPTTELTSIAKPYSELLPISSDHLTDATFILTQMKKRTFDRVGVMSTTVVKPDDAPPGIHEFIDYMGRPWQGHADYFNMSITIELQQTPLHTDRCVHGLARFEDQDQDTLTLVFDWQRTYRNARNITKSILSSSLAEAQTASSAYFEELGIGAQFDEQIINSSNAAKGKAMAS